MDVDSVPFWMDYMEGGFDVLVRMEGLLRADAETLVLEYRETRIHVESASGKEERGEVRSIPIPLDDLESLEPKRGLFGGLTLILNAGRLTGFRDIPDARGSRCLLRIPRRDRERARQFVTTAEILLADWRMKRANDAAEAEWT